MLAFVVSVPAADLELASELLWQLGVRAIEERGGPDPVELWTAVGEDPAAISRAGALLGRWHWRTVEVEETSADTWREYARPMWVDERLVLIPAWQEHDEYDGVTLIRIEPGGAFGLGDHPTTMLSLRALSQVDLTGATMLDVGCGTGVLAVAAALLGAGAVRAVDIADAAVEATLDNARRNAVNDRIVVDSMPIAALDGNYDVVVANILAPTLCELAADLRRLTAPDGRLVISGILTESHDHVLAALTPMEVETTTILDRWASVILRQPVAGRTV